MLLTFLSLRLVSRNNFGKVIEVFSGHFFQKQIPLASVEKNEFLIIKNKPIIPVGNVPKTLLPRLKVWYFKSCSVVIMTTVLFFLLLF